MLLCDSHRGLDFQATEGTEHTENKRMEKENLSTIWPVLYFKADWPSKSYNFDLDVQLIKADKKLLKDVTDSGIDNNCWNANESGRLNFLFNTDWFLTIHLLGLNEHISANKIGMSFINSLHQGIIQSFLMCLRLVRSTAAICPFEFPAEIHEDSIVDIDTTDDFCGINSDKAPIFLEETFEIGDLQLLTDLWSALIRLRRLDSWRELINKEEFFASLDRLATERSVEKFVDFIMSASYFSGLSKEEQKQQRKQWLTSAKDAIIKGDEWLLGYYKDCFQEAFLEKQEEVFSNRTRIGRALNLFFEGLRLPLQHSFLSMCLVLETIFTVEKTEITYQFATRLANITGKTFEQRKDIFERARNVYRERSNIVHGRKSIETVVPDALKDCFYFARNSLQHILLDSKLLALYSDPITIDKTKVSDKTIEAIRNYFRDLDLRRT